VPPQVLPVVSSSVNPKQQAEHYRKQRLTCYHKVWDLHRQGWSTSTIAHKVGLSSRTVQRYLTKPNFPERLPRSDRGKSLLNPYKDYILQRWNQGFYHLKQLFREIQQLGYPGGYMTLTRYTRQLAQAQGWKLRQRPRPLQLAPINDPQQPPLTA
jgi:transposase